MKTAVIIQARVGSTRLPRKVLLPLGGQTVLSRVIDRVRLANRVDQVVVATTDQPADDAIAQEAERCRTTVCRGSESDVLDRYHLAASACNASTIVRITSDCPLVDPQLLDRMLMRFQHASNASGPIDYLSNVHPRTFPHGLDIEIFTREVLSIAHREAEQAHQREHVTPFFYENPSRFRLQNVTQAVDQSAFRWTLDEPADQTFFEAVFRHFDDKQFVTTQSVIDLLSRYPELARLNAHVQQKGLRAA